MTMTSAQIRQAFLDYFASKEHQIVKSSSLVPGNDPTLLFTNAGMVQFKDTFLGAEKRAYTRAASSQRCVRAGGKHNDLENVGYTARHHTFFEMLGNFSFGDYFKKDAIHYSWELLTQVLGLPAEKLLVTVYHTDDEAFDIWNKEIGLSEDKIIRIDTSDNFWSMGDTGPCGPCSEIFYDHGEHIWGGPPGSPEEDGDRFIEIWNLVFMQFNRQADGSMDPLPKPSIDTGMGLERIAAILQNVHSNYEIDIFQHLIKQAALATGSDDLENKSLRVIADHIRSCAFLIVDGVVPSNEGRGYVLRRIVRRAIRHGHMLGAQDVFFWKLVQALIDMMGEAYPELTQNQATIEKLLRIEEEQFRRTLDRGLALLDDALEQMQGEQIPGELVFKLYDTYGFPADLTADVARERNLTIDQSGFEQAMDAQRERARSASSFGTDYNEQLKAETETEFTGYDQVEGEAKVVELFKDGVAVEQLNQGESGVVVLDNTPFYAESGGQTGDTGRLLVTNGEFVVSDTVKVGNAFAHRGNATATLSVGDTVQAQIDDARRADIKLNHTATHLMHAALREVLGEHVTQKGSLVTADRLRFDFSHFEAMTADEVKQVEALVNQQIRANHPVQTNEMDIDSAKASGAMALFGEKYDDLVRVVTLGEFSVELCGGTHVERTGDIGTFRIVSESGIAAGIRRIEAMTGEAAVQAIHQQDSQVQSAAALVKGDSASIAERVKQVVERSKSLEKEIAQLKAKLASQAGSNLADSAVDMGGIKVLVSKLEGADPKSLRNTVDELKNKLGSCVVVLGVPGDGKVSLIVGVSKDVTAKVKAGEVVNIAAAEVGGKGGGRPDMAQAGGNQPENLDTALAAAKSWLSEQLA